MDLKQLKANERKTLERIEAARRTADVFEKFFNKGYTRKLDVYIQLCIHHKKYISQEREFAWLWGFKVFSDEMINDLNEVIDNIN